MLATIKIDKTREEEMDAAAATAEELGTKDSAMNSVADAMRDAAATATEHVAKVKERVKEAAPAMKESLSKLSYKGAYACSYGVTYAAVFIANVLPSDNAVMRGFADGAQAAVDALDAK
ncbi:MAG: hypothetical protein ABSG51_09185 [Terracidiphilus sp.]|jgi:hypothetical protein